MPKFLSRSGSTKGTKITGSFLTRIYRVMKKQPARVFIKKDFSNTTGISSIGLKPYLQILLALEIVEEVQVVVQRGKINKSKYITRGYKLLEKKNDKKEEEH